MLNAIIDQIKFQTDKQKEYYNQAYLRRAVINHCFQHQDITFPFIRAQIKQLYGAGEVVGPFSVKTYLQYILTDRTWLDSIFLALVSSMWGVRISVVRSDSCKTIDYRHEGKMDLEKVEFVLLFNCDMHMGHYNGTKRIDDMMTTAGKLTRSKGFIEKVDKKEREERGYEKPKSGGGGGKKPGDGGDGGGKPGGGGGGLGKDQVGIDKSRLEELQKMEARLKELQTEREKMQKEREDLKRKLEEERKKAEKKKKGDEDGFGGTKRVPVGSSSESERELPEEVQIVKKHDKRCNLCKLNFDNSAALKRHVQKYHKNKYRYKCGKCGRGFMNQFGYRTHQTQHESGKSKRLPCVFPGCDLTFGSKRALNTHCNESHNPNPKIWKCKLCKKPFEQKRYMDQHYIRCPMNKKKPEFFCEVCGTGPFRTPGRVLQHKRAEHHWA